MNRGEIIEDQSFDKIVKNLDESFRNKLEKNIINTKLLTHKCQYYCFNDNTSIEKAEECARNCYKPMMMIKKNVTKLIENEKEKLEKCKVDKKILSKNCVNII